MAPGLLGSRRAGARRGFRWRRLQLSDTKAVLLQLDAGRYRRVLRVFGVGRQGSYLVTGIVVVAVAEMLRDMECAYSSVRADADGATGRSGLSRRRRGLPRDPAAGGLAAICAKVTRAWNAWLAAEVRERSIRYHKYIAALADENARPPGLSTCSTNARRARRVAVDSIYKKLDVSNRTQAIELPRPADSSSAPWAQAGARVDSGCGGSTDSDEARGGWVRFIA